jgi:hypothetical protein
MKAKLINSFKEWIAVMTLTLTSLLLINIVLFFGGRTMDFIQFITCIGAVTVLFILVKLLTPFINYIVRV